MPIAEPQPPLTLPERAGLARWQRLMIASFVLGMILLVAAVLLPLPAWARFPTWLLAILLALASTVLQFSRRCPRCGANIGTQARLVLPAACRRCGVSLRE